MAKINGVKSLIDGMTTVTGGGEDLFSHDIEELLRRTVLDRPEADKELAMLLPTLVSRKPKGEGPINAALDILSWLLCELRREMERGTERSAVRMEGLQAALARHVFTEKGDAGLCAAVGRTLLESRVNIQPVIHDASRTMLIGAAHGNDGVQPADIAAILTESLQEMGISDPFDALEYTLETIGLLEPGCQRDIAVELLSSNVTWIREVPPLMLFHPYGASRSAIGSMLSAAKGESISPKTLRRLVMVRNWFPNAVRSEIDLTISKARRSGVECAPLEGRKVHFIYATAVDGAGEQSFWIAVGGRGQVQLCNIHWKQGVGVLATFIHRLPSVQSADRFMKGLPGMLCFSEVNDVYLEKAMGCALAVAAEHGETPHRGLLRVAELLGTDRWKAEPLDLFREISVLRNEAETAGAAGDSARAITEAAEWPVCQDFADAWFEEDDSVDRVVLEAMGKRGVNREDAGVEAVLLRVLEPRRYVWLERLVLMTLWLKASTNPHLPWQEMFYQAEAVASGMPLKEIPLMHSIAEVTVAAAMERIDGME